MPGWRIEPSSDDLFEERAKWRYDPPYDFYDDDGEPVLNPERFFAVRADDGLVGFFYLEERDAGVFYGLGMRPDLTGRGLGSDFVRLGLDLAHELYPGRRVFLDVAEFNLRARSVYERVGFKLTGHKTREFPSRGSVPFVDMEEQ